MHDKPYEGTELVNGIQLNEYSRDIKRMSSVNISIMENYIGKVGRNHCFRASQYTFNMSFG